LDIDVKLLHTPKHPIVLENFNLDIENNKLLTPPNKGSGLSVSALSVIAKAGGGVASIEYDPEEGDQLPIPTQEEAPTQPVAPPEPVQPVYEVMGQPIEVTDKQEATEEESVVVPGFSIKEVG